MNRALIWLAGYLLGTLLVLAAVAVGFNLRAALSIGLAILGATLIVAAWQLDHLD